MSTPASTTSSQLANSTFRSYDKVQGKAYAEGRLKYHPNVFQAVINFHTSTGGAYNTVVDIGCGPGHATRGIAPYFAHVIGLDPSSGMIDVARSAHLVSSTSEPVRFEVATAEDLGMTLSPPVVASSIDLVIAASAAHWFDMAGFWKSAAYVLRPGGTMALWTSGGISVHPDTPNAAAIQAAIDRTNNEQLKPYFLPGNILAKNKYVDLPLPWNLSDPVHEFDRASFLRKEWTLDQDFFVGQQAGNLDMLEKSLATASPVSRWRQAHPDAVGTDRDVVKTLRREIEALLSEAGVEKGQENIKGAVGGTMLLFKKKDA